MSTFMGTTIRTTTVSSGVFMCPSCQTKRGYEKKRASRFFTLLHLPVVSLGEQGTFIECTECRSSFLPSNAECGGTCHASDIVSVGVRRVVATMARRERTIVDVSETPVGFEIVRRFVGDTYAIEDFERDLTALANASLTEELAELAPVLDDQGRQTIYHAAAAMASAGGSASPEDVTLLAQIAEVLNIDDGAAGNPASGTPARSAV